MKPMRAARKLVFAESSIAVRSFPSMRILPEVTSSMPLRQLSSVVFPQPEGPMMATISPLSMVRSIPRRALTVMVPV